MLAFFNVGKKHKLLTKKQEAIYILLLFYSLVVLITPDILFSKNFYKLKTKILPILCTHHIAVLASKFYSFIFYFMFTEILCPALHDNWNFRKKVKKCNDVLSVENVCISMHVYMCLNIFCTKNSVLLLHK